MAWALNVLTADGVEPSVATLSTLVPPNQRCDGCCVCAASGANDPATKRKTNTDKNTNAKARFTGDTRTNISIGLLESLLVSQANAISNRPER
jgi:hypothetical protein